MFTSKIDSNSLNWTCNNELVQNWEMRTSRMYVVSLLIYSYVVYIMWNAGLDEALARIKIAGRNISNLRYADDTTLMAESEEELKSLLMKVKEESEKVGLKLNIQMFATPWTAARQAPLSMGFSRHEYWSGLPFPTPMINLDSILKRWDITLPTKVCIVKTMVFPVVMYR